MKKSIQTLVKEMESEAAPLRSTMEHIFGSNVQPENLFEVHAGDFWGMFQTRNYMRSRLALANEIHDKIAVPYDAPPAWEVVLWHYQEMLRLSAGDNLGLRYRFPFLLLHLDRDDDAFCFIRYWMINEDDEPGPREKMHKTSKEGDWLYGHEKDSRFLDIFKSVSATKLGSVSLPSLVALACIKMRIMATHPIHKATQGKQLDELIALIQSRNKNMLPALINPTPLLSQQAPDYMSPGTPSECYSIVEDASKIWNQIPGALKRLKNEFGAKPKYDCNLSTF